MVLVDSGVWIDFFRGVDSAETDALDNLLQRRRVAVGDLILTEVLQGFTSDHEFVAARREMATAKLVVIGGEDVAIEAARNYRALRTRGITVRKTIDTLIATRCLLDHIVLLHNDRDFDPFAEHLGLRVYNAAN